MWSVHLLGNASMLPDIWLPPTSLCCKSHSFSLYYSTTLKYKLLASIYCLCTLSTTFLPLHSLRRLPQPSFLYPNLELLTLALLWISLSTSWKLSPTCLPSSTSLSFSPTYALVLLSQQNLSQTFCSSLLVPKISEYPLRILELAIPVLLTLSLSLFLFHWVPLLPQGILLPWTSTYTSPVWYTSF